MVSSPTLTWEGNPHLPRGVAAVLAALRFSALSASRPCQPVLRIIGGMWSWNRDYFEPGIPPCIDLHFGFWDPATEGFSATGVENFWGRRIQQDGLPVLGRADRLGYAASHLLRHLFRGNPRPYHIYDIGYFLDTHSGDHSFWNSWRETHPPALHRLEAIAFRLARAWFGCRLAAAVAEAIDEQITSAIDDVIVSLDGPREIHDPIRRTPGTFERLAAGVHAIHCRAQRYPNTARCTVQALNATHLCGTVETARELGLRSISFLAPDLSSTAFNRPTLWPQERQTAIAPCFSTLERKIEALIAGYPSSGFILESKEKLRRLVAHFRARHGLHSHVGRCNAPWVSAVLQPDGTVRPCFFQLAIGNLADGILAEVLNSSGRRLLSRTPGYRQQPFCQRCVRSLYRVG